jgi:hypothetical protein
MLGCIEGAGRRGIKREKSTRSPRFLKWPLEVEEDMAEREHRASKAGKTGITEHNEQCTRIQKGRLTRTKGTSTTASHFTNGRISSKLAKKSRNSLTRLWEPTGRT